MGLRAAVREFDDAADAGQHEGAEAYQPKTNMQETLMRRSLAKDAMHVRRQHGRLFVARHGKACQGYDQRRPDVTLSTPTHPQAECSA